MTHWESCGPTRSRQLHEARIQVTSPRWSHNFEKILLTDTFQILLYSKAISKRILRDAAQSAEDGLYPMPPRKTEMQFDQRRPKAMPEV